MIRTMKKRKPSRKRTKRHNNIKRTTKRRTKHSIKRRHNKRRKTRGGMWKMFGRRNRETNVSPSLSSSTSEPTTPTSSASDEGEIDWSELERNPRRMPGQTRTNRNCSRNLSPVTSIKPCVQNEEDSIENKGKSCKEIMEICINKEYGEDLPRYMLSPNKMDIMVPALKDTRRGPTIERTNGKVTLYPLGHYIWQGDRAPTPIIYPETIPGSNEYNTLKDEMIHGNVHQVRM